jgi:acetyl esterase/lipase
VKDKLSRIHPELRQAARRAPAFTFSNKNLWLVRLLMPLMPTPRTPEVLAENVHIPGNDDRTRIRLRVYRPRSVAPPTPVLVWLHGGGYVMGRPELDEVRCTQYVRELGIIVVSVDYRCAPRHPFPAGLEDSYSALKWMQSHPQEVKPVFQLLVYPMLDDRTVLRTDVDDSGSVTWNQRSNRFGWESYLGEKCGAGDTPEYAVPARREDLSCLPPAWIGVGTADLFHDEDMAYAQRLREYGVECEVYVVSGAFHGFDRFAPGAPVVRGFRESQMSALRRSLYP